MEPERRSNSPKLNIGCGTDYLEGFINIDGSSTLPKIDMQLSIGKDSLDNHFQKDSVGFIVAHDIVEHFYRWEAEDLLQQFFNILEPDGKVEIRVPDCDYIIRALPFNMEEKLTWLYGGQSKPRNADQDMDESRKEHPEYFCHKYGWNRKRMRDALKSVGFRSIDFSFPYSGKNLTATAKK